MIAHSEKKHLPRFLWLLQSVNKYHSSNCFKVRIFFYIVYIPRFPVQNQIKSSLYSPYYGEACNELRGPSPRLSAWATQLRRNVATMASCWRHCADLTGPGIESQTSPTDNMRLATKLTAGVIFFCYSYRLN